MCVSAPCLTADADTLMELFATRQLMPVPFESNLATEGWMVEIEMLNALLFVQRPGSFNQQLQQLIFRWRNPCEESRGVAEASP